MKYYEKIKEKFFLFYSIFQLCRESLFFVWNTLYFNKPDRLMVQQNPEGILILNHLNYKNLKYAFSILSFLKRGVNISRIAGLLPSWGFQNSLRQADNSSSSDAL